MIDYKLKAQKYKIKYLNLKKKFIGGKIDDEKFDELLAKGFTIEQIFFIKSIEDDSKRDLTDDEIYFFANKKVSDEKVLSNGLNGLPLTNLSLTTIHNTGNYETYYNQCFFISLVDILTRTGIAPGITVKQLRLIGGLNPIPDNRMWDSLYDFNRDALIRICTYFNIEVRILSSTYGDDKHVRGERTREYPIPIQDFPYRPNPMPDDRRQEPLCVYIAHMGLHFEAVEHIMGAGIRIYNLLDPQHRVRHPSIDFSAISFQLEEIEKQNQERLDHEFAESLSRRVDIDQKTIPSLKSAAKEPLEESSGGIILTPFIIKYYNDLVNGVKLDAKQKRLHALIDLLNDTNLKLLSVKEKYEKEIKEQENLLDDFLQSKSSEKEKLLVLNELDTIKKKYKDEINEINKVQRLLLEIINHY
jgi:hypothetical protein